MKLNELILLSMLSLFIIGCGKGSSRATNNDSTIDLQETITVCEVHNITLLEETVEYQHMTIECTPEFEKAMRAKFPHLGSAFGVEDPKIKNALINYCPKCREEINRYNENEDKKHRDKNP